MSDINFSGLASGMDTDSIVSALMEVERMPIDSLESDASYLSAETEAYSTFNTKMTSLLSAVESLDTLDELASMSATSSDTSILTASTDDDAVAGSYDIEVISLAETQKDVSPEGFADSSSTLLSGSLTIGDTTIDYTDITLGDLKDLINDEDSGVSASIIDDGTDEGYRLFLTGDEAGIDTEISGTGSITFDTATDGHTKEAAEAHLTIDGIDIYSSDNTIEDAIPGVTFDLSTITDEDDSLTVTVATNTSAFTSKIDSFVSAYNSLVSWVDTQADADWGNDSSIRSVERKMQNLLTTQLDDNGDYNSLMALGFETDYETGQISYDSDTMSDAIDDDFSAVMNLFSGDDDETDGIMDMFATYFEVVTDSDDGVYAQRKESNDNYITRVEDRIESLELRLVTREATLRSQFTAMEELISTMNTQMSYLTSLSSS